MITLQNITHTYKQRQVLSIAAWEVAQGEHWLLRGKSGTGKTTLLNIICGLLKATEGTIWVAQQPLHQLSGRALDKFRSQHIGIIFQQPYLLPSLNCMDNLLLANYSAGKAIDAKKALELLATLQIDHIARQYPFQISVGEAQRLTIARALMNTPSVIVADEPTSALDDDNATTVIQLIQEQARQLNATLVVATHDARIVPFVEKQLVLENTK
jgi:putative ABC transport system ATP-binding protein